MLAGARLFVALTIAVSAAPIHSLATLGAQAPGCGQGNRFWRSAVGASLGGWAGLVAMKIRYSDWDDASRSTAGIRGRNRGIVIGAVLGASLGNLRFRRPCSVSSAATSAPVPQRYRSITTE